MLSRSVVRQRNLGVLHDRMFLGQVGRKALLKVGDGLLSLGLFLLEARGISCQLRSTRVATDRLSTASCKSNWMSQGSFSSPGTDHRSVPLWRTFCADP